MKQATVRRPRRQLSAGAALAAARHEAGGRQRRSAAAKQRARLIADVRRCPPGAGPARGRRRWLERAIEAASEADEREALAQASSCSTGRSSISAAATRPCTRSGRWTCTTTGQARAAGDDLQRPRNVRVLRGPLGRGGRAVREGPTASPADGRRGRRGDRNVQHRRDAERPGPSRRGAAAVRGGAAGVAGGRARLGVAISPAAWVGWPAVRRVRAGGRAVSTRPAIASPCWFPSTT